MELIVISSEADDAGGLYQGLSKKLKLEVVAVLLPSFLNVVFYRLDLFLDEIPLLQRDWPVRFQSRHHGFGDTAHIVLVGHLDHK